MSEFTKCLATIALVGVFVLFVATIFGVFGYGVVVG
jgi:hypothetical protein